MDETSWNIDCIRRYGWAKKGEKLLVPPPPITQSITGITSISHDGMDFTELIRGSVTHEIFESYLKRFLMTIKDEDSSVVVMDNASIHHVHVDEIIREAGHFALFNAAYSPELNPIENIFSIWKQKAEGNSLRWEGEDHFIATLLKAFKEISSRVFRRSIMYVENEVWPRVLEKKDL